MVRADTRTLGFDAEQLATDFLAREGTQIIQRNFRCRLGEIDLIVRDDRCIAFVEVRYRGSRSFSRAVLTVDRHKQKKLIRTAALYLSKRPRYADCTTRFDVVAIDADAGGDLSIDWIRDAFRPADNQL